MKTYYITLIVIFAATNNFQCSSSKKETGNTQIDKSAQFTSSQNKSLPADSTSTNEILKKASAANDTAVGVLYVTGNEPFTRLSIYTLSGAIYHIEADSLLKSQLWKMQGKRVGIIGLLKPDITGVKIKASAFYTVH